MKGLSEAKADKMVEAAKKLTNVGSWITGMEAMQKVSCRLLFCPAGVLTELSMQDMVCMQSCAGLVLLLQAGHRPGCRARLCWPGVVTVDRAGWMACMQCMPVLARSCALWLCHGRC